MLCWVCAGSSFWGAALLLAILAVVESAVDLRQARRRWLGGAGRQVNAPAR